MLILVALWISLCALALGQSLYDESIVHTELYKWVEYHEVFEKQHRSGGGYAHSNQHSNGGHTSSSHTSLNKTESLYKNARMYGKTLARDGLGKSVYMSLTTISSRIYGVAGTIDTILQGTMWPDHIYIFISEEPYLLDEGITRPYLLSPAMDGLRKVYKYYPHISIVYTENFGPHRKLLPLLAKKWYEDCYFVTVDDHEEYPPSMLQQLVTFSQASGHNSVVARRARRMAMCASSYPPWKLCPYARNKKGLWPESRPVRREMLLLPTGTGGVLYRPHFFHPVVFDRALLNTTITGDDLMFKLGTMAKGVSVVTTCSADEKMKYPCPPMNTIPATLQAQEAKYATLLERVFPLHTRADLGRYQMAPPTPVGKRGGRAGDKKRKRRERRSKERGREGEESDEVERRERRRRRRRQEQREGERREGREEKRKSKAGREKSGEGADRRRLTLDPHPDDRKKVSLASKFNNLGGNTVMWSRSVALLKARNILDFDTNILQSVVDQERDCLFSRWLVLGPGILSEAMIGLQELYDRECGMRPCYEGG